MRKFESTEQALILDDHKQHTARIQSNIDSIDDRIRHFESVLDELTMLGEKPGVKKMSERVAERYKELLERLKAQRDECAALLERANPATLQPFNVTEAPSEVAFNYLRMAGNFEESGNSYHLVEMFVALVRAGFTPPKWVLDTLAKWFVKHLKHPDPEYISTYFGLDMHAYNTRMLHAERWEAASKMCTLIAYFGLSELNAADAVIQMHEMKNNKGEPLSKFTMKNYFRRYFPYDPDVWNHPKFRPPPQVTNDIERTKFLSSVPPGIRKKIKTK